MLTQGFNPSIWRLIFKGNITGLSAPLKHVGSSKCIYPHKYRKLPYILYIWCNFLPKGFGWTPWNQRGSAPVSKHAVKY